MKNKKYFNYGIAILVLTVAVVASMFTTVLSNTKLGLDLQGGIEILYKVEPANGEKFNQELMDDTINVLSRRINTFGISETVISQEGENLIRVQIPGVDDQDSARELLGSSAVMTFRDANDNLLMTSDVLNAGKAKLGSDSTGNPSVVLSIADPAKMGQVTGELINSGDQTMVIWLDFEEGVDSYTNEKSSCGDPTSHCISAAQVRSTLTTNAEISGNFTKEEASNLVSLINSGSLKVNLTEEYSNQIGASFGEDALQKSIVAGIVGLSLVMCYMIFRYRFAGLVSSVALMLYTLMVFIIFYILGGVLTLPGIAALLLGVGMAVDANVITFERIKDFYRSEGNLLKAFEFGNKKSMLTIIDANVTTIIIAIILYIFGQTSIKGFGTMLMINIAVTFLITIFFTRFILKFFVKSGKFDDKLKAFINYSETSKIGDKFRALNYVDKNKVFFTFSAILIASGLIFGQVKGYNVGIDFTSGTSIMATVSKSEAKELDAYLTKNYNVVDTNYVETNKLDVIRLEDALTTKEIEEVTTYVKDKYDAPVSVQKISPTVGKQLIKNSVYSLLIASAFIVVYITFRFRSSFAFAAIFSLIHDLFIMLSIFALIRFTISGNFIAAMLAILGYSINDTIVLFDRIRDNLKLEVDSLTKGKTSKKKKKQGKEVIEHARLSEIVNSSVKETIGRSLTTSFTTMIPIVTLVILGAMEITQFNIALVIGIVFGTYSSIFVAAQLWLVFERKGYFYGKKSDGWFSVEESGEKYID